MNVNIDDEYYKALKARPEAYPRINDTHKDSALFSSGSTVVVKMQDGGLLMHSVIIEGNSESHQKQSYQV